MNRLLRNRRYLYLAVLAIVLASGAICWYGFLEDQFIPKRWGVVEDGAIYRSGLLPPRLLERILRQYHIQVLVDLTAPDQEAERKIAGKLNIRYHSFPLIGDGTGDIKQYARALAVITQAKDEDKPVLVHCAAGSQRTGGVVAAYRVLIEGKLPSLAREELEFYGWAPYEDNLLLIYLNGHMRELAQHLLALNVIQQIPDPLPQFEIPQ